MNREESKGVQGSQRKENRSQAEPHREGLLRQSSRAGTLPQTMGSGTERGDYREREKVP